MQKVAKLKKIVSKPMQMRYLTANEEERAALKPAIESESRWMIDRMSRKGFQLEATVADVYGLFVRGPAVGKINLVSDATPQESLS